MRSYHSCFMRKILKMDRWKQSERLVELRVPKKINISRIKANITICKKHLKVYLTLLYNKFTTISQEFLVIHNCSPKFLKMVASCCFKRQQTIHHWKVYLNDFWLVPKPKIHRQPYIFKFSLNVCLYEKISVTIFLNIISSTWFIEKH